MLHQFATAELRNLRPVGSERKKGHRFTKCSSKNERKILPSLLFFCLGKKRRVMSKHIAILSKPFSEESVTL